MLSKSREEQIKKCFEETLIEFHCLKHNFNLLIETCQKLNRNTDNDDKNDSEGDKNFVFGEKKQQNLISLLSWTTSQVSQISLVTLAAFLQFLEILSTVTFIFFIFCTQINQTSKSLFPRPKSSTFSFGLFN